MWGSEEEEEAAEEEEEGSLLLAAATAAAASPHTGSRQLPQYHWYLLPQDGHGKRSIGSKSSGMWRWHSCSAVGGEAGVEEVEEELDDEEDPCAFAPEAAAATEEAIGGCYNVCITRGRAVA